MFAYYAIRPVSMKDHIRIERAESPEEACRLAFGRGVTPVFEYCLLSTRVADIQNGKTRREKIEQGPWHPFIGIS